MAGVFSVGAFGAGIKGALDLGGSLEDLKNQTGESAGNLLLLQQVLKDNGIEAEATGGIINKMQDSLVQAANGSGKAADALKTMGLSLKDIAGLNPTAQFQAIGKAISALDSQLKKIRAARALFGKQGGSLLGALGDSQGFETAAKALGVQVELLNKNSAVFDNMSDRLARAGLKIQGFFVGVASELAPALDTLTGLLDQMDFGKQGQIFGQGIKTAAEYVAGVFQNPGELLGAFGNYLLAMGADVGNAFANAFVFAADQFSGAVLVGLGEAQAYIGAGLEFALSSAFAFSANGFTVKMINGALSIGDALTKAFDRAVAFFGGAMFDVVTTASQMILHPVDSLMEAQAKSAQLGVANAAKAKAQWDKGALETAALLHKLIGPSAIGESFDSILTRREKNNPLISKGKGLLGKEYGQVDYLGAKGLYAEAEAALDRIKTKGEVLLGGGNSPALDPTLWLGALTGAGGALKGGKHVFKASSLSAPASTVGLNARERAAIEDARVAAGGARTASSTDGYGTVRRGDSARRTQFIKNEMKKEQGIDKTNILLEKLLTPAQQTADTVKSWDR